MKREEGRGLMYEIQEAVKSGKIKPFSFKDVKKSDIYRFLKEQRKK